MGKLKPGQIWTIWNLNKVDLEKVAKSGQFGQVYSMYAELYKNMNSWERQRIFILPAGNKLCGKQYLEKQDHWNNVLREQIHDAWGIKEVYCIPYDRFKAVRPDKSHLFQDYIYFSTFVAPFGPTVKWVFGHLGGKSKRPRIRLETIGEKVEEEKSIINKLIGMATTNGSGMVVSTCPDKCEIPSHKYNTSP